MRRCRLGSGGQLRHQVAKKRATAGVRSGETVARAGWPALLPFMVVIALAIASPGNAASAKATAASETITVSNTSATPVQTQTSLEETDEYRLTVSGTVSDWCTTTSCPAGDPNKVSQPNVGVDGVWCYAKWRCPTPEAWQQLSINGKGILDFAGLMPSDLPYSPSHEYTIEFSGVSGPLSLGAADALAGSTSDNSGSFTVTLVDLGPAAGAKGTLTYAMPDRFGVSGADGLIDYRTTRAEIDSKQWPVDFTLSKCNRAK